jgi:DNA-binding HxlR family transcriptional regulator
VVDLFKVRSYRQYCALARALDVVGDRWTLLLLRELLLGPRRFRDLLNGLPGIGPNLLTARLRHLEAEGLIGLDLLPPPAASRVYVLTDRGRALDETLVALARWGMDPIAPPHPDDRLDPAWYALALRAAFRSDRAGNIAEDYEFRADGVTFHLQVRDGRADARQGSAPEPALVLTTTTPRLLQILTRQATPVAAEIEGEPAALARLLTAFALPSPTAVGPEHPAGTGLPAVSSFDVGIPDELAEPPVAAEAPVDGGVDDSS